MLSGWEDKSAEAVCTFGYYSGKEDEDVQIFQGKTQGNIVNPRGPRDFGWDPCFEPIGFKETFAEMPKSQKNQISHRGRAVLALKEFLDQLND